MKLLKCKLCSGEVEIISQERGINKKIKCTKCGYSNMPELKQRKEPEVVVIKKRPTQ